MPRRPDPARRLALRVALALGSIPGLVALAPPEGPVDLGRTDPRLAGIVAPKGFRVQLAAEPGPGRAHAMAFDDSGDLLVAEWREADRAFDTWDTLALPEGGTARVLRRRKSSTDRVRRLRDLDGDGVFESSEVVLEGAEMPSAILPLRGSLLLACAGRLERWTDEDGDGRFETRAVLIDGFPASGRATLDGITLGTDGRLYLSAGDGEARVVAPDGSRVDLARTGGIYRAALDGSRLRLVARGFRGTAGGLAFDGSAEPFALDDDPGDGSKLQGARLIRPLEDADYGWRSRPGDLGADFERASAVGDRPGKLGPLARLGRGSPSGPVVYRGVALPPSVRGAIVFADPARRSVRGLKLELKDGSHAVAGELALMASEDPRFRPARVAVGADGALYVLDRRGAADPSGRVYRVTWEGEGTTPALPTKPNHWKRILAATDNQLVFDFMASPDGLEADRAQREMLDRGQPARAWCLGYAGNVGASLSARVLGIQGARQLWNDQVEAALVPLLDDPMPEVRRLAAQALAWEPKAANPRLLPRLIPRLDDPDARVVREAALAIGRHAESSPRKPAAQLLRWLDAHRGVDPATRDAVLRGLERMGEGGSEEVALAVRTRARVEREAAVALFAGLRSAAAAEQLDSLVKIPDLNPSERLALVRQFADIPAEIPVPTQGLAEWALKHPEADPAVQVAALDACRLLGNPASSLVLALLDDDDESVRTAAARLAARSRPPGAMAKLAARLKESGRSPAERRATVRALGQGGTSAFATLDAAYLEAEDPGLRRDALRSMAEADRGKALPALEAALSGRDPGIRAEAIRILGESPASAVLLGKAYRARSMGRDDLPKVLKALRKHDSAEPRKLLAAIEDEAARSTDLGLDLAAVRARLERGADPWAGLGVFFRESAGGCAGCHAVEGRGGQSGPALALADPAPSPDRMVAAILRHPRPRPGAEAAKPRDGRAEVGAGVDESVALSGLGEVPASRPDRVAVDLTGDEVADLAAFLVSRPARASLKHGPARLDRVLAVGPFAPGADKLRVPLDRVEPGRALPGQDGRKATWAPLEADEAGRFNLRGEFGSKPGRAYLAVRVKSAGDQSASLHVATDAPLRAYLDGAKIAELDGLDPRPAPIRLPLRPGLNLLVLALDGDGLDDARVALEVASPEPVEVQLPKD